MCVATSPNRRGPSLSRAHLLSRTAPLSLSLSLSRSPPVGLRLDLPLQVGYFTLGGSSTEASVLFFHLRADGSAGLVSSTGTWHGGPYTTLEWLHVEITIEWAYRRADLWLDGVLAASGVAFASSAAQRADEVHLFSFDPGTVWWDDIAVRLL